MAVPSEHSPYVLMTVRNALKVIDLFTYKHPTLGVTEMSKMLGLSKSMVSRMVATLVKESILVKDEQTSKYRLGSVMLELGLIVLDSHRLIKDAYIPLRDLTIQTNESSYLLIPDQYRTVRITSYGHYRPVKNYFKYADPSLTGSICGRTILAFCEDSFVTEAIEYALSRGVFEEKNKGEIEEVINEIQQKGYAYHEEPGGRQLYTMACPLFDSNGVIVAAAGITAPLERFNEPENMLKSVSRCVQRIARSLPRAFSSN